MSVSDVRDEDPRVLPRSEHPISRQHVSANTLKVLYRLRNHGYKAYLVGGGVRDLMLGRQPKDFDIGTDARPEQVRKLFRNSRIIGRRFRLSHVYFRDGVVEVSTFRGQPDRDNDNDDGDLLITDDNTWGTPREDAFRRDFTINALFYNIADFSVLDYVGGIEDLRNGIIRCIGDPDIRFREDPVRMLRACEFAGRLGFRIEEETQEAIEEHNREIEKASAARLIDEIIQLMRCGRAGPAMQWMLDLRLTDHLLPEVQAMMEPDPSGGMDLSGMLPVIDEMVEEGREMSDTALLSALLLPEVMVRRERLEARRQGPMSRPALEGLVQEVVGGFAQRFALSRTRAQQMSFTIAGFLRLCEPDWKPGNQLRFARKPYFDEALNLFEVLVRATDGGYDVLDSWRRASEARAREDQRSEEALVGGRRRHRRRPYTRRRRH